MLNHAHATIAGRLTKDPELKETRSGTSVLRLSVAVNRFSGKGDDKKKQSSFFNVVAFGKGTDKLAENLSKGDTVLVEGDLVQSTYESQERGKQSKVEIHSRSIQRGGSNGNGDGRGGSRHSTDESGGAESFDPPF